MKIVIVIDSWSDGNGAQVATKRLVNELIARGHDIKIVSTGQPDGAYDFYEVPGFYLPFVREAMEKMDFKFARAKADFLSSIFKGADLVHVIYPTPVSRKAIKVARKMGIPVTGASHLQPENITQAASVENVMLEKFIAKIFHGCLYSNAEAIHCPSSLAARMLRQQGSKSHFKVVSNGIPREYKPLEMKRPEWFGDKFVILNIGRHVMSKRQTLLVDAVFKSKYRDKIQLLLCGKGEYTEKLKKMGEQLPVKPLIEYVSDEDKILYLNTADMYIHPSVLELESLSCLEAIGCGLPCVIGDSPMSAASQFALDERFLFAMDNPDILAEKIDYWFENRDLLPEMKETTLEMADNYRFDRSVSEMEKFFSEAVAGTLKASETTGDVMRIQTDYYLNLPPEVLAMPNQLSD